MKNILFAVMFLSATAFAHDGGHGPKVTDAPRQGGVLAPVIDLKDLKKGDHAEVIYKAELVRSEDGSISVYYYDKTMKPIDLSKFDKTAKGVVETVKKKKVTKAPFALNLVDGIFSAKAPKAPSKPFNIDVVVKEGGRDLLTAFDNLD